VARTATGGARPTPADPGTLGRSIVLPVPEPYEFIGFGAMDVTKPSKFTWFGDLHGLKAYKFIGLRWAFISQTPVVLPVPGPDIGVPGSISAGF
jgi:hypothetical protein